MDRLVFSSLIFAIACLCSSSFVEGQQPVSLRLPSEVAPAMAGYQGNRRGFESRTASIAALPLGPLPANLSSRFTAAARLPASVPRYRPPHPTAPKNLRLYRPSVPRGVDLRNLMPALGTNIREYPYLRRGKTSDLYVTPPGMEMPEQVSAAAGPVGKTWRDHFRDFLFPSAGPFNGLLRGF